MDLNRGPFAPNYDSVMGRKGACFLAFHEASTRQAIPPSATRDFAHGGSRASR